MKVQKPILVGGLGLSIVLAFLSRWQDSLVNLGEWTFWGAIALGSLLLWRKPAKPLDPLEDSTIPITKKDVDLVLKQAQQWLTALQTEAPQFNSAPLAQTLQKLTSEKDSGDRAPTAFGDRPLRIVVTGGRSTGKTSVIKQIQQGQPQLTLLETPALFTDLARQNNIAEQQIFYADLVIFLINGDLMDSQWQAMQPWFKARQRVLIGFNKQDQYAPEQRDMILEQLRKHTHPLIPARDVIALSAAPNPIKVKRIQADESVQEYLEQPAADIQQLGDRLQHILQKDQQQLIWSTIWRQAKIVQHKAKTHLNQIRRDRALPILEKYQWIAAGAAFANPVAALDLLATAAITGQLIMDIGEIYQQKFSLQQAQNIATTLGKLMLQLGLVELSTQTLGGILKSNAFTYAAGGIVQGVSAAYLTHIAGLSLIAYFQEQELQQAGQSINLPKLGEKLKMIFGDNQKSSFLQGFTQQAIAKIVPTPVP